MKKHEVWLARVSESLAAVRASEEVYVRTHDAQVTLEEALDERVLESDSRYLSMPYAQMVEVQRSLAQKVARGEVLSVVDQAALEYLAVITGNDRQVEMRVQVEGDFKMTLSYEGDLEKFKNGLRFGLTADQFSLGVPVLRVDDLRASGTISHLTGETMPGLKRGVLSVHMAFLLTVPCESLDAPEALVRELRASVKHVWQPLPDVSPSLANVKVLSCKVA